MYNDFTQVTMKRTNWFFAGMLLLTMVSCNSRTEEKRGPQTVKIEQAEAADNQADLQYPGKVKAAQDISLAFRVSGTIKKMHVKEGTHIRQGQLIAELDPTDYQIQLDATEAEYRQIKGDAERVMALYKENGTTPSANDKAVYGLQQITAKYQHHKDQVEYTRLYAPFNGFVQKRLFDEHETVGAGMPVVSMISGGLPEVEINLPAAEYIRRDKFESYSCTFDLYPGQAYDLKFISITPKANANQLYTMRLQLVADNQPLPSPGMVTMVSIRCNCSQDTRQLSVPTTAVLHKEGKEMVFVFNPSDQKVHCREVNLVRLLSNGRSLITCEGLNEGDQIVSSGIHHIEDGEVVKPLPAVTKTNVGGLL